MLSSLEIGFPAWVCTYFTLNLAPWQAARNCPTFLLDVPPHHTKMPLILLADRRLLFALRVSR